MSWSMAGASFARAAFEDSDDSQGRLLLRLWLAMPNSRPLPAGIAQAG